jgi:hypothetical protein
MNKHMKKKNNEVNREDRTQLWVRSRRWMTKYPNTEKSGQRGLISLSSAYEGYIAGDDKYNRAVTQLRKQRMPCQMGLRWYVRWQARILIGQSPSFLPIGMVFERRCHL